MTTPVVPEGLAELEEERDFLLGSLRDLERERQAGDMDTDDYRTLYDDYAARTAAVLRSIEALKNGTNGDRDSSRGSDPPAQKAAPVKRRRPWALVAGVAGVVMLAVVAGVVVASSSGERVAGQQVSGSIPGANGPTADLARAQQLFGQGKLLEALKLYDSVLKTQPDNVEALTYRGWLLFQASRSPQAPPDLVDRSLASLSRAVAVDPGFPDAHFFRGFVLFRGKGDAASAVPELRAYLAASPSSPMRPQVEAVLNQALCGLGQAPAGTACG